MTSSNHCECTTICPQLIFQCSLTTTKSNEEINDLTESSARSEAAMITELSRLDSQRRADRAEFEKRIQQWIVHDKNR